MSMIPRDIPGDPEVYGVTFSQGQIICATSAGMFVKGDGEWALVKPVEPYKPVYVTVDHFGRTIASTPNINYIPVK